MDRLESDFLKSMKFNPLVWSGYIDDIFFIWTHGEEKVKSVLDKLSKYQRNIKFAIKESIPFLDLVVKLSNKKIVIDLLSKIQIDISIFIIHLYTLNIAKDTLYITKH